MERLRRSKGTDHQHGGQLFFLLCKRQQQKNLEINKIKYMLKWGTSRPVWSVGWRGEQWTDKAEGQGEGAICFWMRFRLDYRLICCYRCRPRGKEEGEGDKAEPRGRHGGVERNEESESEEREIWWLSSSAAAVAVVVGLCPSYF